MRILAAAIVTIGAIAGASQALGQMGMGRGMGGGFGGGVGLGSGGLGSQSDLYPAAPRYYGFNHNNVIGWQLMSQEERIAHADKMRGMGTYDECEAYQEGHRRRMQARANERGSMLDEVNNNACDRMNAKGFFK